MCILRTPRIDQHHSDVEDCKLGVPVTVALLPRYRTRGSPSNVGIQFCHGRNLVDREFLCGTDVCALDSSSQRSDYPEQGGTSVGTRAGGLSTHRLSIAVIVLGAIRHTVMFDVTRRWICRHVS